MSHEILRITDDDIYLTPLMFAGRIMFCILVLVSFYVVFYSVELQFKDLETVQAENAAAIQDKDNSLGKAVLGTEKEPTVLIVFNGKEYGREAQNLINSMKKFVPARVKNIIIGSSDSHGDGIAKANDTKSIRFPDNEKQGVFGSENFNVFTMRKLEAIIYLLQRGHYVLYSDTDIVWLKDPVGPILKNKSFASSDILFQDDAFSESNNLACTGFMYCKPTKAAISIFQESLKLMESKGFVKDKTGNDQVAVQQILINYNGWNYLDKCTFPNGARYFKDKTHYMKTCRAGDAIIVHANYRKGTDAKEAILKKFGLWFL